ncbi:MAG: phage tail tape measure protein, partial [Rhodanobacteraceae bacterium]
MFADWLISATIRFTSNGSAVLDKLAASTNAANLMLERQRGIISANEAAMARYQARIDAIGLSYQRMGTIAAGGVALAGAVGIGAALTSAAKLQVVLQSIQNITGANNAAMERVYNAAFNVGAVTAMSPTQTAEMFREIARQTQGSFGTGAQSLNAQLGILPYAAKFAQVMSFVRPEMSTTQSVDSAINLMHLFRQYDPTKMGAMFDTILRMGELMPTNLQQAVRQMTYFEPTLKNLNTPDSVAATMMVFLSRAGFGQNKGGTGVQRLVEQALGPLQLTKHVQAGKARLLGPKFLDVIDAKGNPLYYHAKGGLNGGPWFDMFGFLAKLAEFSDKHGRAQASRVFTSVFGQQGGRIGQLFADPVLVNQLLKIEDAMTKQKSLGLNAQQATIAQTTLNAARQAWVNFGALFTELGYEWLPQATTGLNNLGKSFHDWQAWLHQNRDAEKTIGEVVGAITLLSGARFGIGAMAMAARGLEGGLSFWAGGQGVEAAARMTAAASGFSRIIGPLRAMDSLFLLGAGGASLRAVGALLRTNAAFEALWYTLVKIEPYVSRIPILGAGLRLLMPAVAGLSTLPFGAIAAGIGAVVAELILGKRLIDGKGHPLAPGVAGPVLGGDAGLFPDYTRQPVSRVHVPVARAPYQGHGLPSNITIQGDLIVPLPAGTTDEQRKALAEALHPQHVLHMQGVHRTSARLPKPLSIGNSL